MALFTDLKISKPILNALEEGGFETTTPIQEKSFSPIKSGKDLIGIAQTGTGKTFAYLIPMLMKLNFQQGIFPRAIVIVPTRELVLQICESVNLLTPYMDIRCHAIYGGVNIRTQMNKLLDEGSDLIVATPGRFMDIYVNGVIRTKQVRTLVVDEADKLMDLGFYPQLKAIIDVVPENSQKMLFSATFSDTIAKLSEDFLLNPNRIEVERQATPVAHIDQLKYKLPNILTKVNFVKYLLKNNKDIKKVIIFTETKKNADRLIDFLNDDFKDEMSVIHSNKAQNTRINALKAFKDGVTRIMVSSDVAARGIDIEGITHVINFDIPDLPEEYVHRIGRTGRAGHSGVAISFISEKEEEKFSEIETLIEQTVDEVELPEDLEISTVLLEDEIVQSRNIAYQKKGKFTVGGAFHQKKSKNTKINGKIYKKKLEAKKPKNKRRK
ncbi:DEAD/DEAH box helicase [Marinilabiliaceae bacterium JC040]|nr:DEAD/DEAH box helicase [Marinilabiliaceae bacterium JC040]